MARPFFCRATQAERFRCTSARWLFGAHAASIWFCVPVLPPRVRGHTHTLRHGCLPPHSLPPLAHPNEFLLHAVAAHIADSCKRFPVHHVLALLEAVLQGDLSAALTMQAGLGQSHTRVGVSSPHCLTDPGSTLSEGRRLWCNTAAHSAPRQRAQGTRVHAAPAQPEHDRWSAARVSSGRKCAPCAAPGQAVFSVLFPRCCHSMDDATEAVCYVCLHSGQGLTRWCKCPSLLVHPLCAGQ